MAEILAAVAAAFLAWAHKEVPAAACDMYALFATTNTKAAPVLAAALRCNGLIFR